jgi:hypothetical protein
MENSTMNISPNGKNDEINNLNPQSISDSLDTIALYLFEAIKRKANQNSQRKGA